MSTTIVDSSKTVDAVFQNLVKFLPTPVGVFQSHFHGILVGLLGAYIVYRQYPAQFELDDDHSSESQMERRVRVVTRNVICLVVFVVLQSVTSDLSYTVRNAVLNRNHLSWVRWFGRYAGRS